MTEDYRERCNKCQVPDRSDKNELLRPVESFTEIKFEITFPYIEGTTTTAGALFRWDSITMRLRAFNNLQGNVHSYANER